MFPYSSLVRKNKSQLHDKVLYEHFEKYYFYNGEGEGKKILKYTIST